jgi:hypothetical protein
MEIAQEYHQGLCIIEKSSINELKRMQNPPSGVKTIMEVFCVIFGVEKSW